MKASTATATVAVVMVMAIAMGMMGTMGMAAEMPSDVPPGPNPIYEATDYMKKVGSVDNGVMYRVSAPYQTGINVVHVYGTAEERGKAYGELMRTEVLNFNQAMQQFFKDEVDQIPLGSLPQWLQDLIKAAGKSIAPKAFNLALNYVYKTQLPFTSKSKADVWTEVQAIAEGVCSNATSESECSAADVAATLQRLNSLPDLIRMQCSMMGAWGKATPDGKLVQMRTLDFGTGPFADASVLVIHHPSDSFPFAMLSFPGFVGAVTGFSQKIGQCEKVNDVTKPKRKPKGTYNGQAVSFVIRDILQFAESKEDAVQIAQAANRTWPVWLGFGDHTSQEFLAVEYSEAAATPYDDKSLPQETSQPAFEGVAYIDKHPQPSSSPDLSKLVQRFYGNMTAENVVQFFPRLTESADVHAAIYDFGEKPTAYISVGITNSSGGYERKAYASPFLKFDQEALWNEPAPTAL
eukprot:g3514.t1